MNQFIRCIPALLLSACFMQSAWAQFNVSGPGFLPDENGTNLDDLQAKNGTPKVAAETIMKDCPECPEMVVVPGGSFLMGSPPDPEPDPFSNENPKFIGFANEKPQHRVQIKGFAIGKYEVTQEQWYAVMADNPSANKGRTLPVEQVSWYDVQEFIAKLNQKTGQKYRLPSEAEWEYAARAGSTTIYPFGESANEIRRHAWFSGTAQTTNPIGLKQPNLLNLFDMLGNVWEWTQDCWHENYAQAPREGIVWVKGCSGNYRVIRGGSWSSLLIYLRSAVRSRINPGDRDKDVGFRLARDQ